MDRITSINLILCITSVLSQTLYEYSIVIDHLEFPETNSLVDFGTLRVKKFNRTTYVVDGYIKLLKDITNDDSVKLEIYTFHGNEYRLVIEKNVTKLCTFLQHDEIFISKIIGKTSLAPRIEICPVPRGYVHFYNANYDDGKLPVDPGNFKKGKLAVTYYDPNGNALCIYKVYFIIERIQNKDFTPKFS